MTFRHGNAQLKTLLLSLPGMKQEQNLTKLHEVEWDCDNCPKMALTTYKAILGRLPTCDRLQNGVLHRKRYVLCAIT